MGKWKMAATAILAIGIIACFVVGASEVTGRQFVSLNMGAGTIAGAIVFHALFGGTKDGKGENQR